MMEYKHAEPINKWKFVTKKKKKTGNKQRWTAYMCNQYQSIDGWNLVFLPIKSPLNESIAFLSFSYCPCIKYFFFLVCTLLYCQWHWTCNNSQHMSIISCYETGVVDRLRSRPIQKPDKRLLLNVFLLNITCAVINDNLMACNLHVDCACKH